MVTYKQACLTVGVSNVTMKLNNLRNMFLHHIRRYQGVIINASLRFFEKCHHLLPSNTVIQQYSNTALKTGHTSKQCQRSPVEVQLWS